MSNPHQDAWDEAVRERGRTYTIAKFDAELLALKREERRGKPRPSRRIRHTERRPRTTRPTD